MTAEKMTAEEKKQMKKYFEDNPKMYFLGLTPEMFVGHLELGPLPVTDKDKKYRELDLLYPTDPKHNPEEKADYYEYKLALLEETESPLHKLIKDLNSRSKGFCDGWKALRNKSVEMSKE